jgi:hypothetical protein
VHPAAPDSLRSEKRKVTERAKIPGGKNTDNLC